MVSTERCRGNCKRCARTGAPGIRWLYRPPCPGRAQAAIAATSRWLRRRLQRWPLQSTASGERMCLLFSAPAGVERRRVPGSTGRPDPDTTPQQAGCDRFDVTSAGSLAAAGFSMQFGKSCSRRVGQVIAGQGAGAVNAGGCAPPCLEGAAGRREHASADGVPARGRTLLHRDGATLLQFPGRGRQTMPARPAPLRHR